MSDHESSGREEREGLLNPVDRVMEMLFGLFMALTFVGAVSVGTAGPEAIRTMLAAALGCNLAWGLVDAVMYIVRVITDRGRLLTLARSVRAAPHPETGCRLIADALSHPISTLVSTTEVEAIRARLVALPALPARPRLHAEDILAAMAIFVIVVASTFPVVLPFIFIKDVGVAKMWSRVIALAMLFIGGLALGRYAGYGSWKVGVMMAGLGTAVVAAIMALGG